MGENSKKEKIKKKKCLRIERKKKKGYY